MNRIFQMAYLISHTLHLLSDLLVLLSILMHKPIKQNLLFNLNFMKVLEWLFVLKVKPIQLQKQNFRSFFNELRLESLYEIFAGFTERCHTFGQVLSVLVNHGDHLFLPSVKSVFETHHSDEDCGEALNNSFCSFIFAISPLVSDNLSQFTPEMFGDQIVIQNPLFPFGISDVKKL